MKDLHWLSGEHRAHPRAARAARMLRFGAALLALAGGSNAGLAQAACPDATGDVNGNGFVNVADALCALLASAWSAAGESGMAPACLGGGSPSRQAADVNCDGIINVTDVQLSIMAAIGNPLPPASLDEQGCLLTCTSDLDGDGEPDWLDCAPVDGAIATGAEELCNGWDDDCSGVVDDGAESGEALDCDDGDPCNGLEACDPTSGTAGLWLTEVMVDPAAAADEHGQWVELENGGDAPVDLRGWSLVTGGLVHVIQSGGALWVPPAGRLVIGRSALPSLNGGLKVHFAVPGMLLPPSGSLVLRSPGGVDVDAFAWGGAGQPAVTAGHSLVRGAIGEGAPPDWSTASVPWGTGSDAGSPGGPNLEPGADRCADGSCALGGCDDPSCSPPVDPDIVYDGHNHINAARLDDQHVVVAWGVEPNPNTAHTGFNVAVWRRENGGWTKGTPLWVNHPLVSVGSDNALTLVGALGPQHFFVLAEASSGATWYIDLIAFRRDGLSLTQLATHGQGTAMFQMGHPIDSTRYLLRYRYDNSGQPVYYRVVKRTGDTLTFGPQLQRPQPNAFPAGAPTMEPQTDDAIVRIGPTTFREIRGGYVWTPSKLTSWVITVNANDTLTASGLLTHSGSGDKTMGPVAVGNGTGGIALTYWTYPSGLRVATLNGTSYSDKGQVLPVSGPSIHADGIESTDGYYGGKYWLRHESGNLIRLDSLASSPTIAMTGLPHNYCYRAPSIIRLGNEAIFPVCTASTTRLTIVNLDTL